VGPYATRFCGGGVLSSCRDALWKALGDAAATLAQSQGSDPAQWRADATRRTDQLHQTTTKGTPGKSAPRVANPPPSRSISAKNSGKK
jgi:hypothetical protein